MATITLSEDQVKRLEAALLELPGKHTIPLLQLINGFIAENEPPKTTSTEMAPTAHVVHSE